jgi:thiosulfate/3-mercaptopyruvate sulfurtransferase
MLGWIGHPERYLLDGGLKAWEAAELPLEAGETTRQACEYGSVQGNVEAVATLAEVEQRSAASGQGAAMLDARAAVRYRGEAEPIDPVAGHVPGALNLAFTELLDSNGKFLSKSELQARFDAALGSLADSDDVIAMCGSGVTACHLLAGLEHIGRSGRLYVGSWSEWIRDASRAIATEKD